MIVRPLSGARIAALVGATVLLASPAAAARGQLTPAAGSCAIGCGHLYLVRGYGIDSVLATPSVAATAARTLDPGDGLQVDANPAVSRDGNTLAFMQGGRGIYTLPVRGGTPHLVFSPLEHHATATQPTWSPDGSRLAFVSEPVSAINGVYGIAIVSVANGALLTTYTNPGHGRYSPTWSPDGRVIVASEDRTVGSSSYTTLVAIDAASGSSHLLTTDPAHDYLYPAFSPDGRSIACVRTALGYTVSGDLWVMNSDGSGGHVVRADVGKDQLAWSPDGTAIAYASGGEVYAVPLAGGPGAHLISGTSPAWSDAGASRGGSSRAAPVIGHAPVPPRHCALNCGLLYFERGSAIDAQALSGGKTVPVAVAPNSFIHINQPAISPDGTLLAYRYGLRQIDIRSVAGGVSRLVQQLGLGGYYMNDPAWSPDSRYLAYDYSDIMNRFGAVGAQRIGDRAEIFGYSPTDGGILYPTWSPDGRAVVVSQVNSALRFELAAVDVTSRAAIVLTHDTAHDYTHPVFSPDGRYIACLRTSIRSSSGTVWVMRPDGSGGHAVVAGATEGQLAWSPDGTYIAYNRGTSIDAVPLAGGVSTVLATNAHDPAWGLGGASRSHNSSRTVGAGQHPMLAITATRIFHLVNGSYAATTVVHRGETALYVAYYRVSGSSATPRAAVYFSYAGRRTSSFALKAGRAVDGAPIFQIRLTFPASASPGTWVAAFTVQLGATGATQVRPFTLAG